MNSASSYRHAIEHGNIPDPGTVFDKMAQVIFALDMVEF